MTMALMEGTGERAAVYVPDGYAQTDSFGFMLGERGDVSQDPNLQALRGQSEVADNWFVYGAPADESKVWLPRPPELFSYATLDSGRVFDYWQTTDGVVPGDEARAAAETATWLTRLPQDGRATLMELPYHEWENNGSAQLYSDALHQLLGADHPENVLRDDTQAEYPDPHGTKVSVGFLGAVPVLLVERGAVVDDILVRLVEIVKTFDQRIALDVVQQFSLVEELRARELARRHGASAAQRESLSRIDRRSVQRDRDILVKLGQGRHAEQRNRVTVRQLANTALSRMVDSRFISWLERKVSRKEKHKL